MPYSFSPFSTFIASIASGRGRPPRMRTPLQTYNQQAVLTRMTVSGYTYSISKAKANVSAVGISSGLIGEPGVSGELAAAEEVDDSSSRFMEVNSFLAVSIFSAKVL